MQILRAQEAGGLSVQRVLNGFRLGRLQGLDLLFAPHWYCSFRVEVEQGHWRHVETSVWTMVEALIGQVLRLPDEPRLVGRDLATLAPAVALPPRIGRAEAVARAAAGLRWDLRLRGRQRLAPRRVELVEARLAHVPFWVGYYADRRGQLHARTVHGVEGSLQSGPLTRALLRALERVTDRPTRG